MARLARVVAAGVPHLVTQRGNRRQDVFFRDGDYKLYMSLLAEGCSEARVTVLAYSLMPDHVHLILLPSDPDGLRAALGDAHRRYTRAINLREDWQGFLWQGRFASFPVDNDWLLACVRYVETAPVREKLAKKARDWRWSSVRAHLDGRDDRLVSVEPLLDRVDDWKKFLGEDLDDATCKAIRSAESTGRPLGSPSFVRRLEKRLGRTLARQKPGPKPKKKTARQRR